MSTISKGQLAKLQTLYAQYARRSLDLDTTRECRLQWASEQLKRRIATFSDLSLPETRTLIRLLQGALGIVPQRKRRMRDARDASSAGWEGRRGDDGREVTLASQVELDRIQTALQRLGWTQERFDAWLRSPSSPLARKVVTRIAPTQPTIRTRGDANRIWWALKKMLVSQGLWEDR